MATVRHDIAYHPRAWTLLPNLQAQLTANLQSDLERRVLAHFTEASPQTSTASQAVPWGGTLTMESLEQDLCSARFGFRIITSEHLVVQYRFPRTKKRRIRKKWRQDPRNWKPDPRAYIVNQPTVATLFGRPDHEAKRPQRLVCHPTLKKHIVSAALRVK